VTRTAATALSAALLIATSLPASAEVLATAVNRSAQTGTVTAALKLTGGGATSVGFNMPAAGRFQIAFSSECAAARAGNTPFEYVSIDILVDGVSHPATITNDDAWCSADATAAIDGWQHPAIVVAGRAAAGAHAVRVTVTPAGGVGLAYFIDDTSLVVSR
jgi:hypothetical protein